MSLCFSALLQHYLKSRTSPPATQWIVERLLQWEDVQQIFGQHIAQQSSWGVVQSANIAVDFCCQILAAELVGSFQPRKINIYIYIVINVLFYFIQIEWMQEEIVKFFYFHQPKPALVRKKKISRRRRGGRGGK